MDTLIERIKEVEKEARNILLDAENEANKMLDDAKFQASSKVEKARAKAYSQYSQSLKDKIDEANQKKEEILETKIQDFYNKLGDVESKKKTIVSLLKDKISKLVIS